MFVVEYLFLHVRCVLVYVIVSVYTCKSDNVLDMYMHECVALLMEVCGRWRTLWRLY